MLRLEKTDHFDRWLKSLRDVTAKARIERLVLGNAGDVRPVGEGISELKVDYGPGYRVYYVRYGEIVIILLCGGDKRTQRRDIETAKRLAAELRS